MTESPIQAILLFETEHCTACKLKSVHDTEENCKLVLRTDVPGVLLDKYRYVV
jgi:hypothetical protein